VRTLGKPLDTLAEVTKCSILLLPGKLNILMSLYCEVITGFQAMVTQVQTDWTNITVKTQLSQVANLGTW